MKRDGDLASFLGGFIAAEGCYSRTGNIFRFSVGLGAKDAGTCHLLRAFLDVGNVSEYGRRRPHYDDEVTFAVGSLRDLIEVVVPFSDLHLPACHKRVQFEVWRDQLLAYWETEAKRIRSCTEASCSRQVRAKSLCRRHYYERFGR